MGQITNYTAINGADIISRWSSTSYPVRSDNQVLPQTSVNDVTNLTTTYLSAAASKMDNIVSACSAAISNSGTSAFSMIDDTGTEVNEFQARIEAISNIASALATKFRKMKTDLDSLAAQCRNQDLADLRNWKNSDEYKQQQNNK